MSKYLWKFYWDCGRQGSVEGLFVATDEEINVALGKEVYFGEILGKHSEVYGTLEEGDLKKLDIESEAVEKIVRELGDTWSGYNPLDYCGDQCDYCGERQIELKKHDDKGYCDYCFEEQSNQSE